MKGDDAYVYGCKPSGFLGADCYVARAPAASLADESAYAYYTGSGRWSASFADAFPIARAGTAIDVAWSESARRFVMAYATPLGTTIHVRSGLAPEGPWSDDHEVSACDLAAPDEFCVGVHLHPELASRVPAGAVALSYVAATLGGGARAPDELWPRLVALPLPPDLP